MADGLDPRTPVIIGTGQLNQRVDRGAPVLEPVDLMAEALRSAEADSGATGVLARAASGPARVWRRARRCAGAVQAVRALPRPRPPGPEPPRRIPPPHPLHGHGG